MTATYRFTNVSVSDGNIDYVRNGTGHADGEDEGSATSFNCKCATQPQLSQRQGAQWYPQYTISGINPSGRHEIFTARCTWNSGNTFAPNSTTCEFRIVS
jgi:hypothetical protein